MIHKSNQGFTLTPLVKSHPKINHSITIAEICGTTLSAQDWLSCLIVTLYMKQKNPCKHLVADRSRRD